MMAVVPGTIPAALGASTLVTGTMSPPSFAPMNRSKWTRVLLALMVTATSMTLAGAPSGAAPADPPPSKPSAGDRVAKPQPLLPPDAYDPAKGPRITPKPKNAPRSEMRPLDAWSVSLTTSNNFPWPTQYVTVTATANQDVGPTSYYLSIYDYGAGAYIAICGSGTTCSVSITSPTAGPRGLYAFVSLHPDTSAFPPPGEQARNSFSVTWRGAHVELSPSPATVPVGASTTLTATVTRDDWPEVVDIGPSPFWIEIYDVTTGSRLAACAFGSSCSVSVAQTGAVTSGARRYVAYLSDNSDANPPTGIQATSVHSYVKWTPYASLQISLDAPRHIPGNPLVRLTATVNEDIDNRPSPYYIEIFDNTTGKLIIACGPGTTCTTTWKLPFNHYKNWHSFVALVTTSHIPMLGEAVDSGSVMGDVVAASSNVVDSIYTNTERPVP